MADMTIESAGTLLADEAERTVTARLVPFGEEARSNLGRFTVDGPVFELPEDVPTTFGLNIGHAREQPIGAGVVLAERADGYWGTWRIANGPTGDRVLSDVKAGKYKHVSVEAEVAIADGKAVSGRIFGAALVTPGKAPAFPSATLLATAATDVVDPTDPTQASYATTETAPDGSIYETETVVEETTDEDPDTGATILTRTTTETTTITPGNPAEGGSQPVTTPAPAPAASAPLLAQRPATVPASLRAARTAAAQPQVQTVNRRTLYAMLAQASRTRNPQLLDRLRSPEVVGTLLAELDDVTFDAAGSPADMIVPQWIGELWSGRAFQRRWIPLFGSAALTSPTVKGWRWKTRPEVAAYSGNKTAVPSGPVETEPYDVDAQPFAGAHDVDRRYRDFNVAEFWDGYFTAMTESYAKQSDRYVPDQLFDPANAATTAVAAGSVPTGVNATMAQIVDGALAILDEDLPSFAVVSKAAYRDLALTREQDNLAFLNTALGLEEGTVSSFRVVPDGHAGLAGGKVLVGSRSAATVHELAGSPIRIEGLDMERGGIDPGLFGYTAVAIHNPAALALVGATA